MNNMIEIMERSELINKLVENGYGDLVEAILCNEGKCFTKNSARLNKSGSCRVLGCKTKSLENALFECRKILEQDYQ